MPNDLSHLTVNDSEQQLNGGIEMTTIIDEDNINSITATTSTTSSTSTSSQQEMYYTPRGSSLSVVGNPLSNTPPSSQHLSPPTPSTSRKNSAAIILEKKDLTATVDPNSRNKIFFVFFCNSKLSFI